MKAKNICAAGLWLLSSAAAQADPSLWRFSYTGFYHDEAAAFDPAYKITGLFIGEDLNHDSLLDRSEISLFMVNDRDYIACPPGRYEIQCGIDRLSYSKDGGLDFLVRFNGRDLPLALYWDDTINSGDSLHHFAIFARAGVWYEDHYRWTPETSFSIVQSPVPEPAQYGMLGAGLLAIARLRRRGWARR